MIEWLVTLLAAATSVAAWSTPSSPECAALGWSSVALFTTALALERARAKRLFIAGCLTYLGGFFWLYSTIKDFGGFPTVAAIAIFLLFVVGSAVQFSIWAFAYKHLPAFFKRYGIRAATAWLIAHHFWIKIFPWDFGHTQIGFLSLAQIADLTGVAGITFLMFWVCEAFTSRKVVRLPAKILSLTLLIASIVYGRAIEHLADTPTSTPFPGTPLQTFLIQGNISLQHKHDMTYFTINREEYVKISAQVSTPDSLVIWPESTITEFLPDSIREARFSPLLPFLNNGATFLVGGLTYSSREAYYNSSILVRPDGTVAEPYHKMILMPFGEYTPLSSVIPFLKEINSTAGQFTPGETTSVLNFTTPNGTNAKVSPLICYEDIVPEIAKEAVTKGAQLLINQTNDAWFGNTIAPYQHHMIATFRAIENRRYLLRSTNTGLTAVVDPLGRTLAQLLPYTQGVLPMEVSLINHESFYTKMPVPFCWLFAAALGVIVVIRRAMSSTR